MLLMLRKDRGIHEIFFRVVWQLLSRLNVSLAWTWINYYNTISMGHFKNAVSIPTKSQPSCRHRTLRQYYYIFVVIWRFIPYTRMWYLRGLTNAYYTVCPRNLDIGKLKLSYLHYSIPYTYFKILSSGDWWFCRNSLISFI